MGSKQSMNKKVKEPVVFTPVYENKVETFSYNGIDDELIIRIESDDIDEMTFDYLWGHVSTIDEKARVLITLQKNIKNVHLRYYYGNSEIKGAALALLKKVIDDMKQYQDVADDWTVTLEADGQLLHSSKEYDISEYQKLLDDIMRSSLDSSYPLEQFQQKYATFNEFHFENLKLALYYVKRFCVKIMPPTSDTNQIELKGTWKNFKYCVNSDLDEYVMRRKSLVKQPAAFGRRSYSIKHVKKRKRKHKKRLSRRF